MGPTAYEAMLACDLLLKTQPHASIALISASSVKSFDDALFAKIRHAKAVVTVEDHMPVQGLGGAIAWECSKRGVLLPSFKSLGVTSFLCSGSYKELYEMAGIDSMSIYKILQEIIS